MSTRRMRCSAIARAVAKLMAVVVLPTPPFWLATAKIRLIWLNAPACRLFHVERLGSLTQSDCSTWNVQLDQLRIPNQIDRVTADQITRGEQRKYAALLGERR